MLRALSDVVAISAETDALERTGLIAVLLTEGPWWLCSFAFHLALLAVAGLCAGQFALPLDDPQCCAFTAPEIEATESEPPLDTMAIELPPITPPDQKEEPELDLKKLAQLGDGRAGQGSGGDPDATSDDGVLKGDLNPALGNGGIEVTAPSPFGSITAGIGPRLSQQAGISNGNEHGRGTNLLARRGNPGSGPDQSIGSKRAVPIALRWLARHQLADGAWSLQGYVARCSDNTCTGPGTTQADSAATAMGLLPFLAANQTHRERGLYQRNVAAGLASLVRHQKPDGDLRCGSTMYAHGLATIALCEAYAMTGDAEIGQAAQGAVNFLSTAQNSHTGGWRYQPGDDGDLSVVGWQVMALKSAQMAGLKVSNTALDKAKRFLAAASGDPGSSAARGLFSYQPGGAPSPTMTSVGLLCIQYLGAARNDPLMTGGTAHLMQHLPDADQPDLYYWYYATQVMHNQPGPEWDAWNHKIRRLLVESQERSGCAAGSWDPQHPRSDRWGVQGGRLMMTSLAALTLEVYYRYLPLYRGEPSVP